MKMNFVGILQQLKGIKGYYAKQLLSLAVKHKNYIPSAIHALMVLKLNDIRPWTDSNEDIKNPFISEKEKKDLIERADWLCETVIVDDPEDLIKKMPEAIGRQFQGQWAIYACSMTGVALCNIIKLYPELKEKYLDKVFQLINLVNTPTIRYYDTEWWDEDAMETLDGNKSHMTYLSILAWMIGNYKLAGGESKFDELHKTLCDTLNRRMLQVPDCNLPSFPNGVVFFPDMMFSIIALKDYGRLHSEEYQPTIDRWLYYCKNEYITKKTSLLYSVYFRNHSEGRTSGAYSGLSTTCLSLIDEDFAQKQYKCLKKALIVKFGKYAALKEYLKNAPKLTFDIDAGPVVYGLSPSGTAFALGAATYFEDWCLREKLLNTASLVGYTVRHKNKRHYQLAEILLTGEAITLAMRTLVNFEGIKNNK